MDDRFKYQNLFFKIVFFVLICLSVNLSLAQDVYRTQNGSMRVTVVSADSIFVLVSKSVVISLNNNTATFKITIDKSTFVTSNKSVNEKLELMKSDELVFSGKFDIEKIDNHDHIPLNFDVEGIISTNNKEFKGKGRLEHISSEGHISCLLTLKFIINKDDLGLNLEDLNLNNEVQIDVVQVLLNN